MAMGSMTGDSVAAVGDISWAGASNMFWAAAGDESWAAAGGVPWAVAGSVGTSIAESVGIAGGSPGGMMRASGTEDVVFAAGAGSTVVVLGMQ
uniref:Uncharacterized protein n=1 Tax=Romanomermis culicivorax TaxID=13658 RepID=A0A915K7V8_ROMCU